MAPDTRCNDAPDLAAVIADRERWIVFVLSREMPLSGDLFQAFDGEVAVQDGNDDVVGLWGDAAIHHEEVAMHVRATANTGATPEDLREAMLHVAIYAGVPAANTAIRIIKKTLAEMDAAQA